MTRTTGTYRVVKWDREKVRAFIPSPLPPDNPPLVLDEQAKQSLSAATAALGRLAVAADMVPSADWFLYGFVRKASLINKGSK